MATVLLRLKILLHDFSTHGGLLFLFLSFFFLVLVYLELRITHLIKIEANYFMTLFDIFETVYCMENWDFQRGGAGDGLQAIKPSRGRVQNNIF